MGTVYDFNCDWSQLPRELIIKIAKAQILILNEYEMQMLIINANKNVGDPFWVLVMNLKNVRKV